jgi:hypothetical protein
VSNADEALLAAYREQRDRIADSDLDDDQPITLTVDLTLGDIRAIRRVGSTELLRSLFTPFGGKA